MNTVRLGRTEAEVSTVGLGTWAFGGPMKVNSRPVGWYGADDRHALEALVRAAEDGINHWDTADAWGDGRAETLIGQVWSEVPRDRIFLASKAGGLAGDYAYAYRPGQIQEQLESSLESLKTDHIDLYYLCPNEFGPNDQYLADAIEALRRFRDEGKIRFIGLSDRKAEKILRYVDAVDPDVVQCYRNVVDDTYAASGLRAWAESKDVGVAFFSPLKHGLLLGDYEGPVTFGEGDHRNAVGDFRDLGLLMRLRACREDLRGRFGEHPQPVLHGLIGALLADAPASCVLVGLHRPEHVADAAAAGGLLTVEDARWVRQLYRENGRPTQASWKSYQETGP